MTQDFDIVIVGGGLVGASLACALRGSEVRVAIVETAPLKVDLAPSHNERTVALAYGSRRILDGIGVWADIERLGATPIEHIHVSQRGGFGVTRLHARDLDLPALGYVVENRILGAALLKTLDGAGNVTWFCPATVDDIAIDAEQARVRIKQGAEERTLSARLIVGADGTQSAVRRLLGIDSARSDYAQVAVVATVASSLPHFNTAYERFTATGPLAALPMRAGRSAIVWSARPQEAERMLSWNDDEFLTQLQERFGDRLGRFSAPGARAAHSLGLTRVPEIARARLVLIGNAAHTMHPVAGQGFNLGLRDVATLTETLLQARRAAQDIGAAELLQQYAALRRRDTRVTELFTDGLIRVFSNASAPLSLARGLGLFAVDIFPSAKRSLLRVTSGLAGRLSRLARGLSP